MKTFICRILGIEYLKEQVELLRGEVKKLHEDNERLQLKLSHISRCGRLELRPAIDQTQASRIVEMMDDFKRRNGGFTIRKVGGSVCKH